MEEILFVVFGEIIYFISGQCDVREATMTVFLISAGDVYCQGSTSC